MRSKSLLTALTILFLMSVPSGSYSGQAPSSTSNSGTLKELSVDLARLNRFVADQVPSDIYQKSQIGKTSSFSANVYERILQEVTIIKDKYQTGPVRVTGFSIDISVPPSVGVQFEFK